MSRARSAEARGEFGEALKRFGAAVAACPPSIKAHLNLALFHLRQGRPRKAVPSLENVLSLDPWDFQAINLMGCIRFYEGDPEDARAIFKKGLGYHPGNPWFQSNLALVLFSLHDLGGALEAIRRVDETSPDFYGFQGARDLQDIARLPPHKAEIKIRKATGVSVDFEEGLLRLQGLKPPKEPRPAQEVSTATVAKKALREPNDLAEAEIARARFSLSDGDTEEALLHLEKAKRASPSYPRPYRLKAAILLEQKAHTEALTELEAALTAIPDDPGALRLKGLLHFSAGENHKAERAFRDGLRAHPSSVEIRYNLAVLLASTGKAKEALNELKSIHYRAPSFFSTIGQAGLAALCRTNEKKALPMVESMRVGKIDFREGILSLEGLDAARAQALVKSPYRPKRQASHAWQKALIDGLDAIDRSDWVAARQSFERALKENPGSALGEMGLRFFFREEEMRRLLHAEIGDGASLFGGGALFYAFLEESRLKGAGGEAVLGALRSAKALRPDDPSATLSLARIHAKEGNEAKAERELKGYLSANPRCLEVLVALSRLCIASGQSEKAERWLSKITEVLPDSAAVRSDLGAVLARQEKYAEAEEEFRKALRVDPSFAPAHYNLACAFALQGRNGEALEALDTALRLGYGPLSHILKDSDLQGVRSEKRFRSLLSRYSE